MNDTFVIQVNHGGLGDHLFLSHLPRLAKQVAGYKFVRVSSCSPFRHEDYRMMVWEMNPFVDGFTDEERPFPDIESVPQGTNLLDQLMLERGIDDGVRFHEPEIFYTPEQIPSVAGATIYDPNFVSYVGKIKGRDISSYFQSNRIQVDYMFKPRDKSLELKMKCGVLQTADLFHYCNLIYSCQQFFCLTSGGATLAAAMKKPAVAFYGKGQNPMFHHSNYHQYVEVPAEALYTSLVRRIKLLRVKSK